VLLSSKPAILLFLLGSIPGLCISQKLTDTIAISEFEVAATKVSVEAPYKKQILDSSILGHYQSGKLSDMLLNETPVFVKSYGSGSLASLSIRGTGASHTQLFWNGISITSPILGQNDFSLLPVTTFDAAEIHYGLSSLEDGSGGLGGALQLNNSENWNNKLKGVINIGLASFGNYSGNGRVDVGNEKFQLQSGFSANSAKNNFEYINIAVEGNPKEKQENGELAQFNFFQNLYYKPSQSNTISLKYNYLNSDRNLPKLVTSEQSVQNLKDDSFRSLLEWSRIKSKSLLSLKFAYLYERLRYTDSLSDVNTKFEINSVRSQIKYKYDLLGWFIQATFNADLDNAISTNYSDEISQSKLSGMVSVRKKVGERLLFHGLVREDFISSNISPLQPSLGLNYEVLKGMYIKLNGARSYRYPSLNELYWNGDGSLGNLDLLPESGWNGESGLMILKSIKELITVSTEITGFYSKIENWILWTPDTISGSFWTTENKQKVENKGFETSLSIKYKSKGLQLDANMFYTYTSSIDEETRKQLIYVPVHSCKLNFSAVYRKFEARFNYNFTDRRYIATDNNWYMPNYSLSSLSIGKQVILNKNKLLVRFSIHNLFDRQYQAIAWRPMPGRNYVLTLRYDFNK
ncbi:MAG: TonB-dependent receptor plug domain-containing protein, partial [Crocinitomicaceae bacterium]|nr:TonB-dependent receptor plug domain-containing protein [Crocinitomicaceae bacterium]